MHRRRARARCPRARRRTSSRPAPPRARRRRTGRRSPWPTAPPCSCATTTSCSPTRDEIMDVIQLESGKARIHAFEEVLDVAIQARYYGHTAPGFLRPARAQGALPVLTSTRVHHRPRGVVGIIAPWNYPFTLGIGDALPALAAGNGVVIKPDASTPFSTLWAAGLLEEAGLPARPPPGGHRPRRRARHAAHRAHRLHHVHRLVRDRPQGGGAVRRAAHELRHGARRQERPPRAAGRAAVAGRPRRRAGHHVQQRPALHQHRADLRARRRLRRVRAAPGRAALRPQARPQPHVRRRHGLARQRRPARQDHGSTSTTP